MRKQTGYALFVEGVYVAPGGIYFSTGLAGGSARTDILFVWDTDQYSMTADPLDLLANLGQNRSRNVLEHFRTKYEVHRVIGKLQRNGIAGYACHSGMTDLRFGQIECDYSIEAICQQAGKMAITGANIQSDFT